MTIISLTALITATVPDDEKGTIEAKVTSDINEGIRIDIPNAGGMAFYSLHDLFASGLIEGVSFTYKEAEKANE
jgi:hypothetical protein